MIKWLKDLLDDEFDREMNDEANYKWVYPKASRVGRNYALHTAWHIFEIAFGVGWSKDLSAKEQPWYVNLQLGVFSITLVCEHYNESDLS